MAAFQCVACGMRLTGAVRVDGRIYPAERGPGDAAPAPCLCRACAADDPGQAAEAIPALAPDWIGVFQR